MLLRDKLKVEKNQLSNDQSKESGIDDLLSDIAQTDSLSPSTQNPLNDLIKGLGFQEGF